MRPPKTGLLAYILGAFSSFYQSIENAGAIEVQGKPCQVGWSCILTRAGGL